MFILSFGLILQVFFRTLAVRDSFSVPDKPIGKYRNFGFSSKLQESITTRWAGMDCPWYPFEPLDQDKRLSTLLE